MSVYIKYSFLFLAIAACYIGLMKYGSTTLDADRNYQKIISPLGNSLIIGTSRAARLKGNAIQESMMMPKQQGDSLLNYAFNLSVSPYGNTYLESIKRLSELVPRGGTRTFIIAIDPWALSEKKDGLKHPETETFMAFDRRTRYAAFRYLYEFYDKPMISFFSELNEHKGERLKNMTKSDTVSIRKHTQAKIKYYHEQHFLKDTISNARIQALAELIQYCAALGDVFMIRIPVSEEMRRLESEYAPDFLSRLFENDIIRQTPLLDYYPYAEAYDCFDGNHLFEEDAVNLSNEIGRTIDWYRSSQNKPKGHLVELYRNQASEPRL